MGGPNLEPRTSLAASPFVPVQAEPVPSPIDALLLSHDEQKLAYMTWQLSAQACMKDKGFEYFIADFDAVNTKPRLPVDSSEVGSYGYNPVPTPPLPADALETIDRAANDAAYRRAFVGNEDDAADGCRDRALMITDPSDGPYQRIERTLVEARSQASLETETTADYVALVSSWSACMRTRGFAFKEPADPLTEYVGRPVDAEQVATRVADLSCQAQLAFRQTVSQLEAASASRWIEAHPTVVAEAIATKAEYLRSLATYRTKAGLNQTSS